MPVLVTEPRYHAVFLAQELMLTKYRMGSPGLGTLTLTVL